MTRYDTSERGSRHDTVRNRRHSPARRADLLPGSRRADPAAKAEVAVTPADQVPWFNRVARAAFDEVPEREAGACTGQTPARGAFAARHRCCEAPPTLQALGARHAAGGGSDQWIAVCGDGGLVEEATGRPLWHATASLAARTVRQALLHP
ncbi:hypothetical protein [Kitasatospora paranensis]|uniref:Uncharacterized protein n=1 Tax=Kitasatospora paranensis TaxID=258053 RepID=A0ABW2G802_9ACTN